MCEEKGSSVCQHMCNRACAQQVKDDDLLFFFADRSRRKLAGPHIAVQIKGIHNDAVLIERANFLQRWLDHQPHSRNLIVEVSVCSVSSTGSGGALSVTIFELRRTMRPWSPRWQNCWLVEAIPV